MYMFVNKRVNIPFFIVPTQRCTLPPTHVHLWRNVHLWSQLPKDVHALSEPPKMHAILPLCTSLERHYKTRGKRHIGSQRRTLLSPPGFDVHLWGNVLVDEHIQSMEKTGVVKCYRGNTMTPH